MKDLQTFIKFLNLKGELKIIELAVDPKLELAEIHRREIEKGGKALLFLNVKGSNFPVVTNLFGTEARVNYAFGLEPKELIKRLVSLATKSTPPGLKDLFQERSALTRLLRLGTKKAFFSGVTKNLQISTDLTKLPVLTSWPEDGGPFITLPLVLTKCPESGIPNLGMYRMQIFNKTETGMHFQIGKGGGFHLHKASELKKLLPLNCFLGGPPALVLSAIAPLPENVSELLLCAFLLNRKIPISNLENSPIPVIESAEFALIGEVDPNEYRAEGPFGDHYGYYSLIHDFPVFKVKQIFHRKNAIYPATIVGKPYQEDYFLGNYLQELLSPIFPLVMPGVRDLWSYGESGFHALSAAVVTERYKREALKSAFRILGEGQLSLTKFLLLVDKPQDLKNFKTVLTYILERADFRKDLYIFSNLALDTLDYTGPKLNHGSRGVLVGTGEPVRTLPNEFNSLLLSPLTKCLVFSPGCLVVGGQTYNDAPELAAQISNNPEFKDWPLVILGDDPTEICKSTKDFIWSVFMRFEPAADLYASSTENFRYHTLFNPPIVIDARMKPNYPKVVAVDPQTKVRVDKLGF